MSSHMPSMADYNSYMNSTAIHFPQAHTAAASDIDHDHQMETGGFMVTNKDSEAISQWLSNSNVQTSQVRSRPRTNIQQYGSK